jgi:hypothetical protein
MNSTGYARCERVPRTRMRMHERIEDLRKAGRRHESPPIPVQARPLQTQGASGAHEKVPSPLRHRKPLPRDRFEATSSEALFQM